LGNGKGTVVENTNSKLYVVGIGQVNQASVTIDGFVSFAC
jgi:hypothetical protein